MKPTPASTTEFLNELVSTDPATFVLDSILKMTPALFQDEAEHASWIGTLSGFLGIARDSLHLVGSARTGVSLNPNKQFRAFDERSDVDIAVISEHHFEEGWQHLRDWGARRLNLPREARWSYDNHKKRHVFWETIATDELIQFLPFGKRWLIAFADMAREGPSDGRVVKARIYRNLDALITYQIKGITRARVALRAS